VSIVRSAGSIGTSEKCGRGSHDRIRMAVRSVWCWGLWRHFDALKRGGGGGGEVGREEEEGNEANWMLR
jgi:hypothetical protein